MVATDAEACAGADDRFVAWNAPGLAARIVLGSAAPSGTGCADDGAATACEAFSYGPDGARYLRKSTWTEEETAEDGTTATATRVSRTYYAGAYERTARADGSTVERIRIGGSVVHARTTTPASGDDAKATAEEAFEYLHRDHLGSVEAVTDESGNELVVPGHDPYGDGAARTGRRSSGRRRRRRCSRTTGGGCRGASRGTSTWTGRGWCT